VFVCPWSELPGVCISGHKHQAAELVRAPPSWCLVPGPSSAELVRPGRRAGARRAVRAPWSELPGARFGAPVGPAKIEGQGPGAKKQAGSRAAQALARFHTLNAARNRIGSPFPASIDLACSVPETHPLDL